MEGRGRLSFVNSEQNNRIKETGLKGSEQWPWLQAGPGHFLRLGSVAAAPLWDCTGQPGTHRLALWDP